MGPTTVAGFGTTPQIRAAHNADMAEFAQQSIQGELNRSQQSSHRPYRTDSASKPFGLKKPPGINAIMKRNGSLYSSNPRFNKQLLANAKASHGETFMQSYKSYRGVAPQSLKKDSSFTAGYATAADRYGYALPQSAALSANAAPFLSEMDFTGQPKDRFLN